jgi:hypothetical protein
MFILLLFLPFILFSQPYGYKEGNISYIMQYRANVREEPNINSNVIVILKFNDQIEILENLGWSERGEQINNITNIWLKIKYGNIIGYTFGGNVSVQTIVTDIDNNGINDYFHFRCSNHLLVDSRTDVIIYINNMRINTNALVRREGWGEDPHKFRWCEFEDHDGFVLIGLIDYGRDSEFANIYKIDSNGNIEYYGYRN